MRRRLATDSMRAVYDDDDPRPRRSSGALGPAIFVSILVSALTSGLMFFALHAMEERGVLPFGGKPAAQAESVEVPALLGMLPDQARELLKARGLLLTLSAERENAPYPAGSIAEQSPLPGSQVQKGSVVSAAVARASKQIAVPALVGLRTEEALLQLVAAHLSAGPQKAVPSDTAAAGTVVDTQPAPGMLLGPQGPVTLLVSSGPSTKPIPKLTGMRQRAARELIEQQGFKVGKLRYDSDGDRAGGVVLDQRPPANTPAAPATPIDLTINED